MRARNLLLVLVALIVAGGTAWMVRGWVLAERARYATPAPQAPQAPQRQMPSILVAKTDLAVGQFVRPDHLRWQPWPEQSTSPAHIVQGKRTLDEFVGAVVRQHMVAGEPVSDARIVSPNNAGFLAAVLEPGFRAVSVPVNVVSGISGFVFPGDRVDLILTHIVAQDSTQERRASETFLRDVRVIAIDQKLESKPGETSVARTVTFEVTPKQSEVVVLAAEMGKLALSLRSLAREQRDGSDMPVDDSIATGFTLDSDNSRLLAPPEIATFQRKVVVVRGDKTDVVKVQGRKQ